MDIKIPSGPSGNQSASEISPTDETPSAATEAQPASPPKQTEAVFAIDAIARDVSAGRISAEEAVEKILAETLDHRSVRDAPEALRLELAEALEALVHNDPHLKSLVSALGVVKDD